jgi:acyl carrier protein
VGDLRIDWKQEWFEREIKQIVSRISHFDEADLQDHVLIREELGVDSLMAMEIVFACEKHLGIKMDETIFADIQTVGDYIILLKKLSDQQNGPYEA